MGWQSAKNRKIEKKILTIQVHLKMVQHSPEGFLSAGNVVFGVRNLLHKVVPENLVQLKTDLIYVSKYTLLPNMAQTFSISVGLCEGNLVKYI